MNLFPREVNGMIVALGIGLSVGLEH